MRRNYALVLIVAPLRSAPAAQGCRWDEQCRIGNSLPILGDCPRFRTAKEGDQEVM